MVKSKDSRESKSPTKVEVQGGFWSQIDKLNEFADWAMLRMGPGPRFIKFNQNINLNKGSLLFIILGLMIYYNNFTFEMWMYLAMHSCYGILWYSKDLIFPDKAH